MLLFARDLYCVDDACWQVIWILLLRNFSLLRPSWSASKDTSGSAASKCSEWIDLCEFLGDKVPAAPPISVQRLITCLTEGFLLLSCYHSGLSSFLCGFLISSTEWDDLRMSLTFLGNMPICFPDDFPGSGWTSSCFHLLSSQTWKVWSVWSATM